MNELLYLLKPGELTLKGDNRKAFENILRRNLSAMLNKKGKIEMASGRFYVRCQSENKEYVENALKHLIGIAGWAKAQKVEKTEGAVLAACIEEGGKLFDSGSKTFKIEARRTDKSFPLDSYAMRCKCGDAVCEAVPGLLVDVKNPDGIIHIEIRERAYIYGA
jgi:thiamine biosynthesis protein ThiI